MLMQCQPRPHATCRYPSERGRLGTEREFSRQAWQVTSHPNWEQGCELTLGNLDEHFMLLHKDISHGLKILIAIICTVFCGVTTRVRRVMGSTTTKPDSGVGADKATVFVVRNNANSCFGTRCRCTNNVKPFHVAVKLQGSLRTEEWFPRLTTQWRGAVLPVGD